MYCDERSQYIRLNSKKNSFRGNYSRKYGTWIGYQGIVQDTSDIFETPGHGITVWKELEVYGTKQYFENVTFALFYKSKLNVTQNSFKKTQEIRNFYTAWPLNTIPNFRFCCIKRAQHRTLLKRLCWLQFFLNPLWISIDGIRHMIDNMGHKINYSDNSVIKKLWYLFFYWRI